MGVRPKLILIEFLMGKRMIERWSISLLARQIAWEENRTAVIYKGISWNGGSPDAGFNMFHLCFTGLVWLGWFPTSAPLVGKLLIWPWLSHDPLPRTDINEGEKLGATKHRRRMKKWGYSGRQSGLVVYLPKFGISSQHSGVPTRITQAFNVWVYQMSDFKARMLATGCRSIWWLLKHQ